MTVARVRNAASTVDDYGDPVPGAPTETAITGAFVAPLMSNDVDDRGRVGVIVGLTLYVPYGTDLVHTDRIRITGEGANDGLYSLDGQPGDWKNPWTGWRAGLTVALTRVAG